MPIRPIDITELDLLIQGGHGDPHAVLGAHPHEGGVTVRVLRPLASSVEVLHGQERTPLVHEHEGVWVGELPISAVPDYRISVAYDGAPTTYDDPYRYLPTLGETDLHLINEGRHEQLWQVLGAHLRSYDSGVTGTSFAVWAPNARGVRLIGDFNDWDGRATPMRQLGRSGVWEIFLPDLGDGATYKFALLGPDGQWREKADPLAFATELPPQTASRVTESAYAWGDEGWLAHRAGQRPTEEPMAVYEVHLGSWRKRGAAMLSWSELADELVPYVSDLGFTHVELMPVMEHPYGGSWGYQVTSYFAPTARFGDPDGLRLLVDRFHRAGIGVLLDWVPAHFPKDEFALARFDGTPLYEHPDPALGEHPEWGTYIFDFGRNEVRNFLIASALYWLEEFHVDGLRVDAVASMLYLDYSREPGEWTPNVHGGRENLEAVRFLQELNATVYRRVPGVMMVAEESTAWPGVTRPTSDDGLGFGFKWNMGWMHDSLAYVQQDPVHRVHHHGQLSFPMVYAYAENYVLPLSHDEVVHGKGSLLRKMPGDRWQQLANLRAYLAWQWAHPGKQLLFMGCELGQESEWAEARELDWWLLDHVEHAGMRDLVRDLNGIYRDSPALFAADHDPSGFGWIDANDAQRNVFSFLRRAPGVPDVVCLANFSPVPHHDYVLGLPSAGAWQEVLNTDATGYAGSGVGNLGRVEAVAGEWSGQPARATIVVPPLATVWLRRAE
ncbi:1,4-alpha-glucan branching protein GlgB [Nocardioides jensenii]|uniref:1,4-alpha-glucan branching protein GlgB n=1 Tax=Nocardioides jensenii TaxID=1843 RepID=UPI00083796E5|nr:1,4-alpha-glucan branching protein GlgB [Nocardioides jensenii]